MKRLLTCSLILLPLFSGALSHAETGDIRYVSDVLRLPLRSGKGNEFRIVHGGMPSGTELKVLEEDTENGWTRVQIVGRDKEGWVRSQYLLDEPTAAIKLKALQNKLDSLKGGSKKLLEKIDQLEASNRQLQAALNKTQSRNRELSRELAEIKQISANAVTLNRQHQELLAKHQMLQTETDTTRAENQRLKAQTRRSEWLFGAFLVVCGILLTLAIQTYRPRKRSSEWA